MREFLVKAKKETYASDIEPTVHEDGCKELRYEEGDYLYIDKYYGSNPFAGEETVWKNGKLIWVMNYYGKAEGDHKAIYKFLRKAMKLVEIDRPFRGPDNFLEGDFRYTDESIGNLDKFKGHEKIFLDEREVYFLEYHGGEL